MDGMAGAVERLRQALAKRIIGHEEPTRRVLEWAALRLRFGAGSEPAPALVGPEGTGTSAIGEALAVGLGLPLVRVELTDLTAHDLRGQPREDGGEPGVLLARLGPSPRAVIILDGVDRLSGARAALALRALLDRRERFVDRFEGEEVRLDASFTLVAAAHVESVPAVLRDLVQAIPLRGYDHDEKVRIAREHLIPRALDDLGAPAGAIEIGPEAVRRIAEVYAPEAGVRTMHRRIAELVRRAGARLALGEADYVRIGPEDLEAYLGPPPVGLRLDQLGGEVGVSLGLIRTHRGGEVALIEALLQREATPPRLPARSGEGDGVVRGEAIESALAFLQQSADALGIGREALRHDRIAVRVTAPPRAVQAARAGLDLAVLVALASVATDRPVRRDLASVGTLTLRGAVRALPGLPEMVLGAARAGVRKVLLPREGAEEVARALPPSVLAVLELAPVTDAAEAARAALIDIVIAREIR